MDEQDDKALDKILEDIKLDDYHFIVKYGRKKEENPDS